MPNKLVAVYGSLKKGFYNHGGLGNDAEFLGYMTVNAVMYSNGSYPKIYHPMLDGTPTLMEALSEDKARDHEVEVYRITEARYNSITRMEIGAGYTPEDIETEWGTATMYWMPPEHFYEADHWVEAYVKDGIASRF